MYVPFVNAAAPLVPSLQLSTKLGNPYQSNYAMPYCVPGSLGTLKPCACGSALVMGVRMVRTLPPSPPSPRCPRWPACAPRLG